MTCDYESTTQLLLMAGCKPEIVAVGRMQNPWIPIAATQPRRLRRRVCVYQSFVSRKFFALVVNMTEITAVPLTLPVTPAAATGCSSKRRLTSRSNAATVTSCLSVCLLLTVIIVYLFNLKTQLNY